MNNLKVMALACHKAASSLNQVLPPAFGAYSPEPPGSPRQAPLGSLFFHLLPFIEQDNVYNKMKAAGTTAGNFVIWTYVGPGDPANPGDSNLVSYSSNYAVFGTGGARLPGTFAKGTSNTILFAEKYARAGIVPNDFTAPPTPNEIKYAAPPVIFTWPDTVHGLPAAGGKGPYYPFPASISPACSNPVYSSLDFALHSSAPQGKTPSQFGPVVADAMACAVQGFQEGLCQVAMGDASVRPVSPTMLPSTFNWAGDPAAPPAPPSDW
jgi:hypothetical protein